MKSTANIELFIINNAVIITIIMLCMPRLYNLIKIITLTYILIVSLQTSIPIILYFILLFYHIFAYVPASILVDITFNLSL